jgi:surface antigen
MSFARWIKKILKAITNIPKVIINSIHKLFSKIREAEYKLFAVKAKNGVFKVQRKTVSFYKRPMSDISHLSIVIVIILTLVSGVSASVGSSENNVSKDPLAPQASQADTFATATEKKILEADSVVTLSGIYSDSLGQDALAVAENLNKQLNVTTGSGSYLSSMPIVSMPDTTSGKDAIIKYVVQNGDTLWSIAQKFNVTTDTIRYANQMTDVNSVTPGETLIIPPVTGVIHIVASGETLSTIAAMYNVDPNMIISQNDLYGENITPGMQLVIPDAVIPAAPTQTPASSASTTNTNNNTENNSYNSPVNITYGPNHFPWGYCTWWVAQQRYVPWSGNAWQWYGNAQAYGRSVGQTPEPGAIMVTWESGYGHVAYVESVSGNSFTVSEMNYKGFGIVDTRSLTTSSVPLIGFIY